MIRFFVVVLALVGLSACTPTTTTIYPENYTAANCFNGTYAFDLELNIPPAYGQVIALTQHSIDSAGLRTVCRLVPGPNPTPFGQGYPIYTGEVDNGRDGLCVSARTSAGGHVLSCASAAQVRRAMSAAPGSRASAIRLSRWQPYGS
ncbi:hypothetical protein KUL25_07680 [Rhodobacteraceae bacterium N5(2021)]|uniref:Uncharacterized protein n=1 Tax=Gymnodinialimonas phycosphaerae TaxID=2841589 RepID=A0A975YHC2_9RHOB|nr:hypothetical protein [Gymnodinialimonas phycosphaerae]MBY4892642.1 hypothetical protein [Gymnodinialimonas phycosphaerae]